MAKLVDALDLGSSGATHQSSSLCTRTKTFSYLRVEQLNNECIQNKIPPFWRDFRYLINLPIATAVSHMRFEKPHSLSYHAVTCANFSPNTLV